MPKPIRKSAPPPSTNEPFWQTRDGETARLYLGHVTDVLAAMPERSVHCVVTSPPYWGLRDYGTGTWEGGDPACDHVERKAEDAHKSSMLGPKRHLGISLPETNAAFKAIARQYAERCGKCGATRTDQQLGSEPSPDCGTQGQAQCGRCFVCAMVAVFRGVRRVLRDDGVLWLNLGDTYANTGACGGGSPVGDRAYRETDRKRQEDMKRKRSDYNGLKSGNLVGVPWRVALALQADGWVLRQDVIWHKPSPMPESVRNRCTKAHEYVFLLTKGQRYFCDMEAIKEDALGGVQDRKRKNGQRWDETKENGDPQSAGCITGRSNKRSVWSIASQGYEGAHFATFPPKLIEPMIKAGTSERGCCPECGAPWKRIVEERQLTRDRPNDYVKRTGEEGTGNSCANSVAGVDVKTVGWEPTCTCLSPEDLEQADMLGAEVTVPCTVLDPFIGSGTTICVAIGLGRRGWGIDLSEKYLRNNAIPRIEGKAMTIPALADLVRRPVKAVRFGQQE